MKEEHKWHLKEAVAYYREQGAPGDQQALIALLREVQQEKGGALPERSLEKIAHHYEIKKSLLHALVRQVPDLRMEDAPHTLEICGHKACKRNGAEALCAMLEAEYGAPSGKPSAVGHFTWKAVGCMKKCGKGPVIRWDGETYTHVDAEKLREIIRG